MKLLRLFATEQMANASLSWRAGPGPPQFGGQPVTNIRNISSPHWRGWLGKNRRCIVPATSFCEYADTKPRKTPTWFALTEDRPLFAFAGLWTPWRGEPGPKGAPIEGNHELFGFLTTEANAVVAPIHPKAMPVILRSAEEADRWLEADTPEALALQRPLPDDALRIVAKGEKEDAPPKVKTQSRACAGDRSVGLLPREDDAVRGRFAQTADIRDGAKSTQSRYSVTRPRFQPLEKVMLPVQLLPSSASRCEGFQRSPASQYVSACKSCVTRR